MKVNFSIVIPSGRPDRVFHTVEGLRRQSMDRAQYEIIIVTPEPENMQELKAAGVRIIGVERLYAPGKMRNIGASVASGEILFFIDDDCIPPPNWLERLMATLKGKKNIGAVGCRVVGLDGSFWSRCADYALFASYQYHKRIVCNLGSAAIGVRREAFEDVHGFDEELLASEDWDFSLKLKEKNWICLFDPSVEVKHDHRCRTLKRIIVKAYLFGHYAGLVVQARHSKNISWLARISVRLQNTLFYSLMIFPYGLALTFLYTTSFVRNDRKIGFYLPFMLISYITCHIGVFCKLLSSRRC